MEQIQKFSQLVQVLQRKIADQLLEQNLEENFWTKMFSQKPLVSTSLRVVLQMKPLDVAIGLSCFVTFLQTESISSESWPVIISWLYALLSRTSLPLEISERNILRKLTVILNQYRIQQFQNDCLNNFKQFHLIITLISRYFGQNDLSDYFEKHSANSSDLK